MRNAIPPDEIAVAVGQRAQVSEIFSVLDWLTAHIQASLPLAWHFLSAVYTPVILSFVDGTKLSGPDN